MKNTRKKILAMILALVMAMSITAFAADTIWSCYYDGSTAADWADYTDKYNTNDSAPIDETDLSQYTAENSKYAIRNGEIVSFPNIFTPDGKADPEPHHGWAFYNNPEPYNTRINEITDITTPIGTVRETWDYLRENFNVLVANEWFNTTRGEDSALLDWLLSGDADRQYSYIYKNYGRYNAWSYIDHACGYKDPVVTDEELLYSFKSASMYPKNGKTVGTGYILTVPTTNTTPEPTATVPVDNTQTSTAPVTVTPGEIITVTVNGVPMQLEAVVITDANGGATTYFKLRDIGDAVGFQVDWTAATGITINSK